MSLPAPNLDDLRFQQDLVDEARKRIIRYCPEWTDYNLSDPGITLIELFAWMTELMVYRLNRVPDKNYVKFLELLGLQRRPASSARTNLTFWLSVPLPISPEDQQDVLIPQGLEVRSNTQSEEEIVFSTNRDLRIIPPVMTYLFKDKNINKNFLPRLGIEAFYAFDERQPKQGDTFYIGFDPEKDISGHIVRLSFTNEATEAVGIRREDPPWVWECALADGSWQEVPLSMFQGEKDTTGGLNNPSGSLVLYLPLETAPVQVHGRNAYWVRCRIEQRQLSQGMYSESPRIISIEAHSLGAAAPATHAQVIANEYLGKSNGDPGQEFKLSHAPILDLQEGETLMVEEYRNGEYVLVPWKYVNSFSASSPYDRHYILDSATGVIKLGPSIRQPDGSARSYGRTPENGRDIYFKSYRYGGGAKGNLPVNTLQTMSSSIAYVARVTNLVRASGGQDQEDLEEVKLRAQRELQAQKRAVTAQDFEQLTLAFSRSIARVNCVTPKIDGNRNDVGVVQLLVVPAVVDSLKVNDISRLYLDPDFIHDLVKFLDQYRLLTTHVSVREPNYLGVKVKAQIVVDDFSSPEIVLTRVNHHLQNFLNPLVPFPEQEEEDHLLDKNWIGWQFGKDLFAAEIYALIQRVPGVKYVMDVEISSRPVQPRMEAVLNPAQQQPLKVMEEKVMWISPETLICSLNHEITAVELSEIRQNNG
jgi:predicted phage baseplate assembly protein